MRQCCENCQYFIPFKTLFKDVQEPENRGICFLNAQFHERSVEFYIAHNDESCDRWKPNNT